MADALAHRLTELLTPVVEGKGLHLEGVRTTRAGRYSVVRVLVDLPDGPGDLDLDALGPVTAAVSAALDQAAAGPDQNEVKIVLPKLDLTSGPVELLEMLKALGLDTSSLDGIALGLSISQVVQQVRLLVDEEGTVAADLTEVGLTAGAAPDQSKPIDFVVDHPYVLRLRDLATGTTLVQAAIMDPTA